MFRSLGLRWECTDPNDFQTAEVVVVNPAVRPGDRLVELAQRSGAQITSETELFLNACPATVVGVTGTVGKSTTATMLADMLAAGGRRSWLGGNIGHSLLADLPSISADDIVVIELSSFQLYWLNENASWPRHAIVTNCSPNHLEWHGSWGHYVAAKRRLVSHLSHDGVAVLSSDDSEVACWQSGSRGRAVRPSMEMFAPLQLIGDHNRANAALAAAMARELGVDDDSIYRALKSFVGLPHRLQFVAEISGLGVLQRFQVDHAGGDDCRLSGNESPNMVAAWRCGKADRLDRIRCDCCPTNKRSGAIWCDCRETRTAVSQYQSSVQPSTDRFAGSGICVVLATIGAGRCHFAFAWLAPAPINSATSPHRGEEFQKLVRTLVEPQRRGDAEQQKRPRINAN